MINVYIISGFLGSGKTTFIQRLLKEKTFEKVMLLENEFGEVGVDAAFFDKSLKVKEINNGCICCSLQGDFKDALEEIEEMGVSDLIIEPSGVGKLSEIIDVIKQDRDFRIVCHICIVDVNTAMKYHKNFKDYFDDQVKAANALILSHLDVATQEKVDEVFLMLNEINDDAYISRLPIEKYTIDDLMDIIVSGGEIIEEHDHHHCCHHHEEDHECECHHHDDEECECHHHDKDEECKCHHHEHLHHHGDEDFVNVVLRPDYVFEKEELEKILNTLDEDIIRAKGYVFGKEGTLYFNYVLNEANVYYGETLKESLVVVIASHLDEKEMRKVFHE